MSHDPGQPTGHEAYRGDLAAYALGALEEPEAAELEGHLAECEACRIECAGWSRRWTCCPARSNSSSPLPASASN